MSRVVERFLALSRAKRPSIIACIALAAAVGSANAGTIYNCEVKQYHWLQVDVGDNPPLDMTADGPLLPQSKDMPLGKFHIGKRFTVDTGSGVMLGELMNVTSPDVKRHILDPGSSQSAFKLLETWGPIRSFRYTTIITFDNAGTKPFVMVDDGSIISGECR